MAIITSTFILVLAQIVAARAHGRQPSLVQAGSLLAHMLERLGGVYVKLGQILADRHDLFPAALLEPFRSLQESVKPFAGQLAVQVVERSLRRPIGSVFSYFDLVPLASASIAQVHRAVLRESNDIVVVKVRRPQIAQTFAADTRMFGLFVRLISWLPPLRNVPLREAFREIAVSLEAQTDFVNEAKTHGAFLRLFAENAQIKIPCLVDRLCTDEILVMEYLPGLMKLSDPALELERHQAALIVGLQALYFMIFVAGLMHCDLHAGNIFLEQDGIVVILDFGFAARLQKKDRTAFAEFFLSIARNDGSTAARILRATALYVPARLDEQAFEHEIADLVSRVSARQAGEFLVAEFVASLFDIQRRHGIYGAPGFTMAIISLAVYEGLIKLRSPNLDFQREAIPFVLAAMDIERQESVLFV